MRKLAIAVALSSTLLATPAFARDGAWYVGGDFGAMIVEDIDVRFRPARRFRLATLRSRSTTNMATMAALFVGYDLGAFRIEAEVAYKQADSTTSRPSIRFPGEGAQRLPRRPRDLPGRRRRTSALSFMINGMLDFGDDDGISGFVGGGVGMARVKLQQPARLRQPRRRSSTIPTRGFAWQVVRRRPSGDQRQYRRDGALSLLQRRRHPRRWTSAAHESRLAVPVAQPARRHHLQLRRLRRRRRRPPPPPPPPPAAAAAAACRRRLRRRASPGPFIVFFDWDKDEITPQAAAILDNAAAAYQTLRPGPGDARRPRRPFGFGRLQRRPVAASRQQRPRVPGRPRRPRRRR